MLLPPGERLAFGDERGCAVARSEGDSRSVVAGDQTWFRKREAPAVNESFKCRPTSRRHIGLSFAGFLCTRERCLVRESEYVL